MSWNQFSVLEQPWSVGMYLLTQITIVCCLSVNLHCLDNLNVQGHFLVMPSSIRNCSVAFSRKLLVGDCFVGQSWSSVFDRLIVEKLCPTLTSAGESTRSGWRAGPISQQKMLCCCLSGSFAKVLYVTAFFLELLLASCGKDCFIIVHLTRRPGLSIFHHSRAL